MWLEGLVKTTETCQDSLCPGQDSALPDYKSKSATDKPICLVPWKHFLQMLSIIWVKAQENFWRLAQFPFRLREGVPIPCGSLYKPNDILKAFCSVCEVKIPQKSSFVFVFKILSVVAAYNFGIFVLLTSVNIIYLMYNFSFQEYTV